jgi:hypothetical protein
MRDVPRQPPAATPGGFSSLTIGMTPQVLDQLRSVERAKRLLTGA